MRLCPDCHATVPDQARFCENCGLPFEPETTASAMPVGAELSAPPPGTCSACGYQNVAGELFCQNCGMQLAPVVSTPPPPPKPASAPSFVEPWPDRPLSPGGCPTCGHVNRPGDVFCNNCGMQLITDQDTLTDSEATGEVNTRPQAHGEPMAPAVPSHRLVVQASGAEIHLPPGKSELLVGRTDPARKIYPDIDLTPFDGERKGVSRLHARLSIHDQQYWIEDLNSTNFSYLNKQKLQPGHRYALSSGDELRLGLLVLQYLSA